MSTINSVIVCLTSINEALDSVPSSRTKQNIYISHNLETKEHFGHCPQKEYSCTGIFENIVGNPGPM